MKTDLTKGVRRIILTKSEINAINLAHSVCAELGLMGPPEVVRDALTACEGLLVVMEHYCPDATESKPESAKV